MKCLSLSLRTAGCLATMTLPLWAHADILQIQGQYAGQINGQPVAATAVGVMDTTGVALNHFELTFQSLPAGLNPFIAGNCWKSSYHPCSALPAYGAENLFTLSAGNYIAGRTVRWASLPGEQIEFLATVTTSGGVITASQTVNGTYSGPSDLIGVSDYRMVWTQVDPTTIRVDSTARILRASGGFIDAEIVSVYSELSRPMPFAEQVGSYTFLNQTFDGIVMSDDWNGMICPAPGSTMILAAAVFGWGARQRRR